jgi:putative long chain acyl-CoA synthase
MSHRVPSMSQRVRELGRAVQNALELTRLGGGVEPARTPYTLAHTERAFRLRRYAAQPNKPRVEHPILLVPSLMVSADLFDLSPDASVVQFLSSAGIDTFLCDFGCQGEADAQRTQDDYLRAVDAAIEHVRELTGRDPHLAGHSLGGMLAYQAAARRRGEGLKSLVAFSTPVDLHQNTSLDPDLFGRAVELVRRGTLRSLHKLDALPSGAVDLAFRLISIDRALRRGAARRADNDTGEAKFGARADSRAATDELKDDLEARRSMLAQRAFAAWSGPALRKFTDELLLSNRLMQGGFLVDGRVCSLSDLNVPLLYFVAERDDIAKPRAVRAIQRAAPQIKELYEIAVSTGHVGLVIGRRAFESTWPSVVAWLRWREGAGPKPAVLLGQERKAGVGQALSELHNGIELLRDAGSSVARTVSRSVQSATRESLRLSENLRLSVARLAKIEQLTHETRISFGLTLAESAAKTPDSAWFLYDGRGQSYRDADQRVDHVVRALIACGVRPGQHVGVLMNNRPSYLSLVTALSRLGAVAVLLSPHSARASLVHALQLSPIEALVTDPDHVTDARAEYPGKLLLLGAPKEARPDVAGVVDMEAIDTARVPMPEWYRPNPGRADELAMILFTAGLDEEPRATHITNRRWAVAAYSAAAFAALSAKDTVYACTPLHHASSMLVAVGGALAGGARLALAKSFHAAQFWPEVRRYGASVVFYSGDMLRELTEAPSYRGEQHNPIRLFAGSGMRADTERRLLSRFGEARVLEYYASAEGPGILANTSTNKIGSFGKPPAGDVQVLIGAYDFHSDSLIRDGRGQCLEASDDEPGILLTRIDEEHARSRFDAQFRAPAEARAATASRASRGRESSGEDVPDADFLVRDVQRPGDLWYFTGDVMRRDPQGDHWPLDRASDVIHTSLGLAFTRPIEDVLYELPDVRIAVVAASREARGKQRPEATLVMATRAETRGAVRGQGYEQLADLLTRAVVLHLSPHERPHSVRCVDHVPMTDGNRPRKRALRAEQAARTQASYRYDAKRGRYVRER